MHFNLTKIMALLLQMTNMNGSITIRSNSLGLFAHTKFPRIISPLSVGSTHSHQTYLNIKLSIVKKKQELQAKASPEIIYSLT